MDRNLVDGIVTANGIYDIVSAASILFFPQLHCLHWLANLHIHMFKLEQDMQNPALQRVLAYWIFTYGCTRLAISARNPTADCLVMASYFTEAAAYVAEDMVHARVHRWKAAWVGASSCVLAFAIYSSCDFWAE